MGLILRSDVSFTTNANVQLGPEPTVVLILEDGSIPSLLSGFKEHINTQKGGRGGVIQNKRDKR
jgi:hypothetical protein